MKVTYVLCKILKFKYQICILQHHAKLFYKAKDSYERQDWHLASAQFESALDAYWTELEKCRLLCEKSFDHGWFPDFVSSVASTRIFFKLIEYSLRHCIFQITSLFASNVAVNAMKNSRIWMGKEWGISSVWFFITCNSVTSKVGRELHKQLNYWTI